jgi:hypothetical protein
MKHLLNAIRVTETSPSAMKATFGVSIPARDYAIPAPVQNLASDGVSIAVQPRGSEGLPLASPRVTRWDWSQLEMHPTGTSSYDAEGRSHRDGAFEKLLTELPPSVSAEHAPYVFGHAAHLAMGLGLSIDDAVAAIAKRVGAAHAEADIRTWALAATDGGASSFYPFDGDGCDLDAIAAAKAAAARPPVEPPAAEDPPNDRTLDELGLIAFELAADAQVPVALSTAARLHAGEYSYALVRRVALAGAHVPEGVLAMGVAVLPGDFVLPLRRSEIDALVAGESDAIVRDTDDRAAYEGSLARWIFEKLRPKLGILATFTKTAEHDESSVDGRYRVSILESLARDEVLPQPGRDEFQMGMLTLFDAGVFGLSLADDVVASTLHRRIEERWSRACLKPSDWDAIERDRAKSRQHVDGSAWGLGKAYILKEWKATPLPAWCATEETLLEKCRSQRRNRTRPFFIVDELYVPPGPSLLDRFTSIFRTGDDWTPTIEAFVTGKAPVDGERVVRQAEVETALRDAGLVAAIPLQGALAQRVFRIMTSKHMGWKKGDRIIDGRRTKCWVKA